MKKVIMILVLMMICINAEAYNIFPNDWNTQDTVLQVLVIGSLAIDRNQSNAATDGSFKEVGGAKAFIGSHSTKSQNDKYFASVAVGHTFVSMVLPKHWQVGFVDIPIRTIWQSFWFGVEVNTIYKNKVYCGLSVRI